MSFITIVPVCLRRAMARNRPSELLSCLILPLVADFAMGTH